VLHNQGKAKATNASVKIVAGAGTLAGVQGFDGLNCAPLSGVPGVICTMDTLGAGVDAKATIKIAAPTQPTTFVITATADAGQVVDESSETNNVDTATVAVAIFL
jgi:hypothetical protein